jgi:ArsR family transcriptional regulator
MQIETIIRALADPTRLRIVRLLARMELAVGELAQVLGQSQPRVSRHIRILCDAGLARRRREGSWVFVHSLLPPQPTDGRGLLGIVEQLLSTAEREDTAFAGECAADRRRLAAIRAGREAAAAEYFAAHADQWDKLRSLHSKDSVVEAALAEALGGGELGDLLDIGTGSGRMAELFAPRARHVTAFDKSLDMLRVTRARLQGLAAERFNLVQGDFAVLPFADRSFDTVLLHQVLHYAQAPETVLAEAARVTRPGGRVAIVDFAAHDREELRQVHAHARLGFGEQQLAQWLSEVGFAPDPVEALPGAELTVMIWTGTRRGAPSARIAAGTHEDTVKVLRQ